MSEETTPRQRLILRVSLAVSIGLLILRVWLLP